MGIVSSILSPPKMPAVPPPPAPPPMAAPPTAANPRVAQTVATNRARATAAAGGGASGTIATSPRGLTEPPSTAKATLLGATAMS